MLPYNFSGSPPPPPSPQGGRASLRGRAAMRGQKNKRKNVSPAQVFQERGEGGLPAAGDPHQHQNPIPARGRLRRGGSLPAPALRLLWMAGLRAGGERWELQTWRGYVAGGAVRFVKSAVDDQRIRVINGAYLRALLWINSSVGLLPILP